MRQAKAPVKGKQKDEAFWDVLNAALELDFRKGHLKWTMSELSRKAGITRSLIYYHFGQSKPGILVEAVKLVSSELLGTSRSRLDMWSQGKWYESIHRSRQVTASAPHLAQFYLMHRDRPTEIGQMLQDMEKTYLKKLRTIFPQLSDVQIRAVFTLFFGVVFCPLVDQAVIEVVVDKLKGVVGEGVVVLPGSGSGGAPILPG